MNDLMREHKKDILTKHPFLPGQEYPSKLLLTTIPRIYGVFPNNIPTWMHLSTNLLTHAEFVLMPGRHFEPPDIHSGDELYYILAGNTVIFQPESGQVISVEKGDVVHIPKKCPHISYNFSKEKSQVLTFFAPSIWPNEEGALLDGKELQELKIIPGFGSWNGNIDTIKDTEIPKFCKLGHFPVDGKWSRQVKIITQVKPEKALFYIHGQKNETLLKIFVSNDLITLGTIVLNANSQSDMEKHSGDEVIHVLSGQLSIEVETNKSSSLSVPRFELVADEKFFIPNEIPHRYHNFSSEPLEFVFAVAPDYGIGG